MAILFLYKKHDNRYRILSIKAIAAFQYLLLILKIYNIYDVIDFVMNNKI